MWNILLSVLLSLINSVLIVGVFYVAVYFLNKPYELNIKTQKFLIKDKVVIIIGILCFIVSFFVTFFRFPDMTFELKTLTTVLLCALPILSVCDIKKTVVPNMIIVILLIIWAVVISTGIIMNVSAGVQLLGKSLGGGLIAGAIFLLCYIISKKQLGAGDVKVAFCMGLYMTTARMFGGIFYGSLACCIFSIIQMCRKKLSIKSGVPMVPFLYFGCIITYIIL